MKDIACWRILFLIYCAFSYLYVISEGLYLLTVVFSVCTLYSRRHVHLNMFIHKQHLNVSNNKLSVLHHLARHHIMFHPIKRIEKLKTEVKLHVLHRFRPPTHVLVRRVENVIQHTPHHGTSRRTQVAIRPRRVNPLEKADEEAEMLDDVGSCQRGVLRMTSLERGVEKLHAKDATARSCKGHDLEVSHNCV